jgi:hypothetical protein
MQAAKKSISQAQTEGALCRPLFVRAVRAPTVSVGVVAPHFLS